jgi:hypothetical protein
VGLALVAKFRLLGMRMKKVTGMPIEQGCLFIKSPLEMLGMGSGTKNKPSVLCSAFVP